MKNVQGPNWKNPWKDPKNNDNVFFNEDEAVVSVDLSKRCDSHTEESFCRHCLPRLVAAVDAARRCIDPKAEALVIRDISEGEGETYVLDLATLKKAWITLKGKYPKIYKRVVEQSWDAGDADVFLQLAVFDDVIYG